MQSGDTSPGRHAALVGLEPDPKIYAIPLAIIVVENNFFIVSLRSFNAIASVSDLELASFIERTCNWRFGSKFWCVRNELNALELSIALRTMVGRRK